MPITEPRKIVISRTDSIGDVALTLPLAGILREKFPTARLIFLGNSYTRPVIACSPAIDEIWEWNELSRMPADDLIAWLKTQQVDTLIHVFPRKAIARLAKKAGIKNRIGTSHRLFHLLTCNFRPGFTRKNSDLHESQLNTKLLVPLGIERDFSLEELYRYSGFEPVPAQLPEWLQQILELPENRVILHPKSQGSALEWDIQNFMELARELAAQGTRVFFTGTEKEGLLFRHLIPPSDQITDLTGKLTLQELIVFIAGCHALVAASTGPLHLAGLTGIRAVGLFSSRRPIHPGRWKPLGNEVVILQQKNSSSPGQPLRISVREVIEAFK